MKSLIVFESQFGNTAQIAEAVAVGLREHGPVQLVGVDDAPASWAPDVDLLVLGAPTHALSMSWPSSRVSAASDGAEGTTSGLREWLDKLPSPVPVPRIAVFSTKQGHTMFTGSAAKAAAKSLRNHGTQTAEAAYFVVKGKSGPLEEGERERATAWARSLAG